MKKIIFLLFLLISITANATNYYVKTGGNDALSGLDDANAWETLTKVNATNYSPGDTIFFKRGNTWIGQISPLGGSAESGTEASPIVFSAYGTGAKPIITKADTLPGWSGAANWRSLTSNRYAIAFIPAVSRFLVNTGSGLTEIRKASSIQAVNATNRYYIKASVDSLYIYATSNPSAFYTNIIATYPSTTTSAPFYLFDDNWITASYLDFQGGYYSAFTARGEGIVLDSCRIGYYSAYFGVGIDGAVGNYSDNVTIKNCEINANCTFTESFSADYTEDGVNISGGADNVIIENCTVKNWWHSGIYLKNLSASYYNDSIIIRDNDVSAPNISDGRGINVDTYGQNSTNVIIYRNYIHDTPVQNQINCYGVRFYYNIINNVTGCSYETGVGSGLDVNGYNTSTLPQYGKFYNNVIANCADYGILTNHYTGRPHKKGNEFINNIVINCDSAELRVYNNATDVGLYDNIYRNNLFYDASTTDVISYWNAAGVYVTTDEFNVQNGHEGDAILSNLGDDPLFTGAADFNLLTGSPAINAGIDVGLVTDYALTGVPQGIYVDIGAYEFEAFPIATTGLGWEDVLSKRNFKDDVNIAAGFFVDGVPIVFSGGAPVNIPGLTASASELNILDGATVTTAEVNYSDGVTSNIQTQITSKADISLSNLGVTAINEDLLPNAAGTIDLGSATYPFDDVFLDTASVINFHGGDVTITHSDQKLTMAGGTLDLPSGVHRIGTDTIAVKSDITGAPGTSFAWIDSANYYTKEYNILDYGATSGGTVSDVAAIQAAIDAAAAGVTDIPWMHPTGYGGKVVIPAGEWYIDAPDTVRSFIEIDISAGAIFRYPAAYSGWTWVNPRSTTFANNAATRKRSLSGLWIHGGYYDLGDNANLLKWESPSAYNAITANTISNFNTYGGDTIIYFGAVPASGGWNNSQIVTDMTFNHVHASTGQSHPIYIQSGGGHTFDNLLFTVGADTSIYNAGDASTFAGGMMWDYVAGGLGVYNTGGYNYYQLAYMTWKDTGDGNTFIRNGTAEFSDNLDVKRSQDPAGDGPMINFIRRRAGGTNVANGTELGEIAFQGVYGDTPYEGAAIRSFVNGTPGSSDMPASLGFYVSPDGASTATRRLYLADDYVQVTNPVIPTVTDGSVTLGASIRQWGTLYMYTDKAIRWNSGGSGQMDLLHAAGTPNTLTLSGGNLALGANELTQTAGGNLISAPRSTGTSVGTSITAAMLSRFIYFNETEAIDLSADPQIEDGSEGQIITIIGISDTNTLTLDDGAGLMLSAQCVLGVNDTITLAYLNGNWVEISRSNN